MRFGFSSIICFLLIAGCSGTNQQNTVQKTDLSDILIPPFANNVQYDSIYSDNGIYFTSKESVETINQWYTKEFIDIGWKANKPNPDGQNYKDQFPTAYEFTLANPQDPSKGRSVLINMRVQDSITYVLIERFTYSKSEGHGGF